MKKIIAVALVSALAVTVLCACSPSYEETTLNKLLDATNLAEYDEEWTPTKDKAVVIIHGLMDGAMYEASTEEGKSDKGLWDGEGLHILGNFVRLLTSDEECLPTVKVRIGNMNDSAPYSANGMTEDVYEYFAERYSDEYDVVCWQYDWRQHLDSSARQLDRFLTQNGYGDSILIGHSMGTCVISRYLAMGKRQRDRVSLFIPFGGPMLGSVDAGDFLFEKEGDMENAGLMSQMTDMAAMVGMKIESLARNFATAYHLMVSDAINATPHYAEGQTAYKLGGNYISASGLHEYLKSQSWARTENGTVKVILDTLDEFQSGSFINGEHISRFVPTEYVVGMGINTVLSIDIDADTGKVTDRRVDTSGDGLVPAYSASAGLPLDSRNVHILQGRNHMDILQKAGGVYGVLDTVMARLADGTAGSRE